MKILVFPTDDRLGQASVISHYSKLGHEVYVPKFGTLDLNWNFISVWPSLLCKNSENKINAIVHPLNKSECFGEDIFLDIQGIPQSDLSKIPTVNLIDEEQFQETEFDVYHTLRGGDSYIKHYENLLKGRKNIAWVSSTMSHYNPLSGKKKARNIARIVPANYQFYDYGTNTIDMFCDDVEYDLFGISRDEEVRLRELASFNHNYKIRQPKDYSLFAEMNKILEDRGINQVLNYGGNIRSMGADIRYNENGPTGNLPTLSPIENVKKYKNLSGVVHFKANDWGGGVFFHSLHSSTPLVITDRYVRETRSGDYLIDGYNCRIVSNATQAADAVESLLNREIFDKLSSGMKIMKQKIFGDSYWQNWKNFLDKLT